MRVRRIANRCRALTTVFLAMLGALALGSGDANAQAPTGVRGTVIDSVSRQPVSNVQVTVGTGRGVLTDQSGRFLITGLSAGTVTVRAQRIGFTAQERRVTVANNQMAVVNFQLRPTAAVLSDIVVVGYGTQSRANVSGAVANVQAEAIQRPATASVDQALQGKAPGVQVVQNAGNPGNGITVRIRGSSSIAASNQPLYVIDGVPMIRDDMSQMDFGGQGITAVTGLNPDEIESIDVLKDAAAAAIYGSRGSNGVVMITTKRGRPGQTRFSLNSNFGQQKLGRRLELLNAQEYVEYMAEAIMNDADEGGYTDDDLRFFNVLPGVSDSVNTDWVGAVTRTAPVTDMNLGVQGGGDRFQYLLSVGNFRQQGIIIGTAYDRQNARLNFDFTATPKLTIRSSIGTVREHRDRLENDNTIEGAGANAQAVQPNIPLHVPGSCESSGGCVFSGSNEGIAYANPRALAEFNRAPANTLRLIGNIEAAYDFSDRIRLNTRVGADVYDLIERRWDSPRVEGTYAAGVVGVASQGTNTATRYMAEAFSTVDALRSRAQTLTFTVGSGVEFNRQERVFLRGEGFGSDQFQYPGNAGKVTDYGASPSEHNLLSVFSRANYSLLERYIFSASLRTDGSSRFGEGRRFGVFPAASFGWRLTEEPQLRAISRFVDAKLRASYGETGNSDLPTNFGFLTSFGRANYAGAPGIASSGLGNPNLRWETTREFDVGADFGFLGGRVSVIADYYRKLTSDLLVQRPITSTSGFSSIWDNVGSVENRGWELQLTTENVRASAPQGLTWRSDFNVSHNRNRVRELHRDEPFNRGIRGVSRVQEGQPLGAFYTVKFTGVDPQTGDAQYEDTNNDGDITAADRQVVGSPHPDYTGGLRNTLSWRGFDLNTFLQFAQGQEVFNLFRLFSDDAGYYFDNKVKAVMRRWQKPGDVTDQPRPSFHGNSNAYDVSSRFVEDGSYVRLDEVTLGYGLPRRFSSMARLSEARLYVSGRNLKLWTDYTGYDPDVNSHGVNSNVALGVDFYAYPRARTVILGVTGNW